MKIRGTNGGIRASQREKSGVRAVCEKNRSPGRPAREQKRNRRKLAGLPINRGKPLLEKKKASTCRNTSAGKKKESSNPKKHAWEGSDPLTPTSERSTITTSATVHL